MPLTNNPGPYLRVRITGTLTACSALHIGTGELDTYQQPKKSSKVQSAEPVSYNSICRDADNQPYIPGSSLRGFLRAQLTDNPDWADFQQRWFGLTPDEKQDKSCMGTFRVHNACLFSLPKLHEVLNKSNKPIMRSHVRIEPRLGVAMQHALFNTEYVPKGSVFAVCFEVEQVVSDDELSHILGLLESWNGKATSAVGGGSGTGLGRLQWKTEQVQTLDETAIQEWLKADINAPLPYQGLAEPKAELLPVKSHYAVFKVHLIPQGLFLINDPLLVKEKTGDKNKDKEIPTLEFSRTPEGYALVPGASLRGWVRGQARRILLTIAPALGETEVDALLAKIFGSTERRGRLQFDDLISDKETAGTIQTFNAIDRFTGGVANEKLYCVRAAEACELSGEVQVGRLDSWAIGLLLLVVRDALEGDLLLGWGKNRGYGQFVLQLEVDSEEVRGWGQMIEKCAVKPHIEALHKLIT